METEIFSKYLLPIVLGLIMFNLGLSLQFKDFKRTFGFPRPLILGLTLQIVLLPVIAFFLAYVSGLPPAIQVGIVLIAACPGGATSNLITYLLKGDVALSISLTSINSIIILLTIPLVTFLALETFLGKDTVISLPFLPTILKIIFMILLPTFLGLMTRNKFPHVAKKIERYMKYITTGLLAIVFGFTILTNNSQTDNSFQLYLATAPFALALNVIGMISGFLAGRLVGFSKAKQITLVVEVGIQNSALAITIASSAIFLGNPQMAIPGVIYGMFTFFNAVLFGYIIRKWF